MSQFTLSDFNFDKDSIQICREHVREMLSQGIDCSPEQCEFCPFGRRYRKTFKSCSQFRISSSLLINRNQSDSLIRENLNRFLILSEDTSRIPSHRSCEDPGHKYCHRCINWIKIKGEPHKGYCSYTSYAETKEQAIEEYHDMTGLSPQLNSTVVHVNGEWRVVYDVRRTADTCLKYRGL